MIVDKLRLRLEPLLETKGLKEIASPKWLFERTHAKKNPEALKWTLTRKGQKLHLASVYTVKELLQTESYSFTRWDHFLLVAPKRMEKPLLNVDGGVLKAVDAQIATLTKEVAGNKIKSQPALLRALGIINQLVSALNNSTQPVTITEEVTK